MTRRTKMNVWVSLWNNTSHITKIRDNDTDTSLVNVLEQLYDSDLSIEQIEHLSRVVELAYKTGKEDALK